MENNLGNLRKERKLTLQKLSNALDNKISYATLWQYENGFQNIPVNKAIILADYYNVSLDYLVGLTNIRTRI